MQTLIEQGFLAENGKGFVLGGALIPLGTKALSELDLPMLATPVLESLTEVTEETSHYAVWSEGRVLILAVNDGAHPLRAASRPGTRALAHASATGKVLLAFNFVDRIAEVIPAAERERRTERTILDDAALERELRKVVALGYAVDNEEYHNGVRCVAAPVYNAQGRVCGAIGVTASATRLSQESVPVVAVAVKAAATRLSARLGWMTSA